MSQAQDPARPGSAPAEPLGDLEATADASERISGGGVIRMLGVHDEAPDPDLDPPKK